MQPNRCLTISHDYVKNMVSVQAARSIGERVRLQEDRRGDQFNSEQLAGRGFHKDQMLRNGLLISEAVTPKLEIRVQDVCKRLLLPREAVTAFVYNSSEVQADCVIDSPQSCVLRFTSGLVNLMDEKEFQFVAAHEIGHFLLDHGACSYNASEGSTENFMIQRARELSADRLGFLGTGDLDGSIQAIIKTASGLSNEFLRFDVTSFMSQASLISSPHLGEARDNTHPSLLIRCRALLWFSMVVSDIDALRRTSAPAISKVDSRVTQDLQKFVDGRIRARKTELSEDVLIWKICTLIICEGALKKDVQQRILNEIGEINLNGLKTFLDSYDYNELPLEADKRLKKSLALLYEDFPGSADEIESIIFEKAYKVFKN
jgi:hypothetical protein